MGDVVAVTPRRRQVTYKGMHGYVEYKPKQKIWIYKLKLQHTVTLEGEQQTEAEAVLELKKNIELAQAGKNKNARTVD